MQATSRPTDLLQELIVAQGKCGKAVLTEATLHHKVEGVVVAVEGHLGAIPVVAQLLQALDGNSGKVACVEKPGSGESTLLSGLHEDEVLAADDTSSFASLSTCVCGEVCQDRRPSGHK